MKGILRQYSVARTPQQNGVAERRNRTLFEAARTMLADSKLATTFWADAVNTACYVQNKVSDRLLFDIDALTRTMNYEPIVAGTQSNGIAVPHDDGSNHKVLMMERSVDDKKTSIELPNDPNMPALEDYIIFDSISDDQDDGAEADMNNLDTTIQTILSRNINPVAAKQVALDNALVSSEKRLKIEKCNVRIEFSKPQREEIYQVTLDALKLYTCYPAFLITAEVPEEFGYSGKCDMLSAIHTYQMYQPWRTFVAIINRCISRKTTGLDRLRELRAQILLGMYNKKNVDFMINQDIKDSKAYKTYLDFATGKATPKKARKFKKVASPSRKLSSVLEEIPAIKPKRAKRPAKKFTTVPTTCVVIRETPSESVPKKKTPTKVDRGKGMDLLSDVALHDGVSSLPKVPDEQKDKTIGDSGDDDDNDDDSDEVTKDANDDDVDRDVDEEEYEEEYIRTPDSVEFTNDDEEYGELYKNVNVRLQATEHEEEGKGDEEITDVGRDEGTQQTIYEQVKDDEHVILTTIHDAQKTEVPLQSSSVSSHFANQFLNLENVLPTNIEVISMMNVKVLHEEPSTQTPPLLNIHVTVILETSTTTGSAIPSTIPPITPLP
ncbi:retrovirus-related pol polyprotein from transposon TNT 1-94 [Tanacetum coccineum]